MNRQPDLFPPGTGGKAQHPPQRQGTARRLPSLTLMRVEAVVRILVRLYLGVLVAILPWLTLWTQNNLFTYSPWLTEITGSGFARGVVCGLGLLNIVLAVANIRSIFLPR